jgi:hypothetical protein
MSTTSAIPATIPTVVLDLAAEVLAAAGGPPRYTLSPQDARALLDQA